MSDAVISFPALGDFSICPSDSFVLLGHTFYWYGVIIACGFLLAVAYCCGQARRLGLDPEDFLTVVVMAVPGAIVGARIYYVVFYGHYDSFWDMCKIWEGGLAIYGGLLAGTATVFVVCRVKNISPLTTLDGAAPGLLIGQSVGRWGNFINREAFGYETEVFCRMGLTLDGKTIYVHPTFLYESLWNLAGFVLLHWWSRKTERAFAGEHFVFYLGWYGLGRAWIEGLRADCLMLGSTGIRISQAVAVVTAVCAGVILVGMHRSRPGLQGEKSEI